MTHDEARALIAEGRKHAAVEVTAPCGIPAMTLPPCDLPWGHDGSTHANHGDGFAAAGFAVEHARRQWLRTNLRALLTGYAEAMAEVERLRPVAGAATKWRHAQCDAPNECGDGYTHHGHDCPTNECTRALVAAVDALEPKP